MYVTTPPAAIKSACLLSNTEVALYYCLALHVTKMLERQPLQFDVHYCFVSTILAIVRRPLWSPQPTLVVEIVLSHVERLY